MSQTRVEPRLQPLARARIAGMGEVGRRWCSELPGLLADLEEQWSLRVGRGLAGGSASYVAGARVTRGEALDERWGEARVVKVALPGEGEALAREAAVLAAADGAGYVRLHAHDPVRHALLLESLGESAERALLGPERTLDALAPALLAVWRTPWPGPGAPPGASRATELADLVRELDARHPGACSPRALDRALGLADWLARTDDPAARVLTHGDPHPANLLRRGDGWALVDPDGCWADPAYDCGVAIREGHRHLEGASDPGAVVAGWAARLAAATGLDAARIEAWGHLERVSTGLYVLDIGAQRLGSRFLATADLLAAARAPGAGWPSGVPEV